MRDKGGNMKITKFALLILSSLKIRHFDNDEEFHDAMRALKSRSVLFVPLKYHHGAQTYLRMEVCE